MPATICPQTETFRDLEPLIRKVVGAFARRYKRHHGRDLDELFAEACWHYQRAAASYDPARGSFRKRIVFSIWTGLLETHRSLYAAKRRRVRCVEEEGLRLAPDRQRFDLRRVLFEASPDACRAVTVALEQGRGKAASQRSAVMSVLLDLGWSMRRVLEAFGEVKALLCD